MIQIDGIHIDQDPIQSAAVGVDCTGDEHPLGVMEGASENAVVCQALIDDLVGRGLDPAVCRLFIIDDSRALSKAIGNSFGRNVPIRRRRVHKASNITERLPKPLHVSVHRAWELDDAEKLPRNLARRLEREAPGVSAGILEGIDGSQPSRACGCRPAALVGPHQHHREHERLDPSDLPCREEMAGCGHGPALDGSRDGRSRQELSPTEGPQAVAQPARRPSRSSGPSLSEPASTLLARLHSLLNQRRPPSPHRHRTGHPPTRYGKPEIFNTDQGSQFTSAAFTSVLIDAGVAIGMDGKGARRDNVFVERLGRSVKCEEVYLRFYATVAGARTSIGRYLDGWNGSRPHSSRDRRAPDKAYFDTTPLLTAA